MPPIWAGDPGHLPLGAALCQPLGGDGRDGVSLFCPAKINLSLQIVGKVAAGAPFAGYHLLDSLVAFAAFGDCLQLERVAAPGFTLSIIDHREGGAPLSAGADNLVVRAASSFMAALPANHRLRQQGIRAILHKILPLGGGIGGGSSNAAACLWGLQQLAGAGDGLSQDQFFACAQQLGADVPVCLACFMQQGNPQHMQGIGEQIAPAPAMPAWYLLLVNPGIHHATPAIFARRQGGFSPASRPFPQMASPIAWLEWLQSHGNDLLAPAASLSPAIDLLCQQLQQLPGALYAGMSGSGASCFALFADQAAADAAAAQLRAEKRDTSPLWSAVTRLLPDQLASQKF